MIYLLVGFWLIGVIGIAQATRMFAHSIRPVTPRDYACIRNIVGIGLTIDIFWILIGGSIVADRILKNC